MKIGRRRCCDGKTRQIMRRLRARRAFIQIPDDGAVSGKMQKVGGNVDLQSPADEAPGVDRRRNRGIAPKPGIFGRRKIPSVASGCADLSQTRSGGIRLYVDIILAISAGDENFDAAVLPARIAVPAAHAPKTVLRLGDVEQDRQIRFVAPAIGGDRRKIFRIVPTRIRTPEFMRCRVYRHGKIKKKNKKKRAISCGRHHSAAAKPQETARTASNQSAAAAINRRSRSDRIRSILFCRLWVCRR